MGSTSFEREIAIAPPSVGPLTPQQEFALLGRILHREGFAHGFVDTLSGHITYRQPDGTILTSPFGIPWSEVTASDVVVADETGEQIGGRWAMNPGTALHFALHRVRPSNVTVHNHPRWATTWANCGRVPPIYDQTGLKVHGRIVVVDEYAGHVADDDVSRDVVAALHDAEIALLAHHGVLLLADTIADALIDALAIEARSRTAWQVEALDANASRLVDEALQAGLHRQLRTVGYASATFEALVRREVRIDSSVLD